MDDLVLRAAADYLVSQVVTCHTKVVIVADVCVSQKPNLKISEKHRVAILSSRIARRPGVSTIDVLTFDIGVTDRETFQNGQVNFEFKQRGRIGTHIDDFIDGYPDDHYPPPPRLFRLRAG